MKTPGAALDSAPITRFKTMPRVTITVPDVNPQPYRFQLDRRVVTLGRGNNNDIVIDCGSVSGSHAEMRRIEGGYELHDLDSTNGIKLDGERMLVIPLQSGLSVKLGDVFFDFQLNDEELQALALENTPVEASITPEPEEAPSKKEAVDNPERTSIGRRLTIWFLLIAMIAFCTGMAIRYQKETGSSWIQGVITRFLGDSSAAGGGK